MMNADTQKIATLRFATGLPVGGGPIGTAVATVDVVSSCVVVQTLTMTAQATLPPPRTHKQVTEPRWGMI